MQIRSSRSHRPSARLSWLACAASASSLISAVAVVNRTRRRWRQAATHNPVARWVFPVPGLADQQDRLGLGHVIALGQRAQLRGRDAGAVELERFQRLHPRQPRLVQQPRDRAALALLHLGRQQRLEVADMGLSLAGGGLGQPGELAADRRHPQRLAVLADGLRPEARSSRGPRARVETAACRNRRDPAAAGRSGPVRRHRSDRAGPCAVPPRSAGSAPPPRRRRPATPWRRPPCAAGHGQTPGPAPAPRPSHGCQTARKRDPRSACKKDPLIMAVGACPGSEQEGPARPRSAFHKRWRSGRVGGACLPTWASVPGTGERLGDVTIRRGF